MLTRDILSVAIWKLLNLLILLNLLCVLAEISFILEETLVCCFRLGENLLQNMLLYFFNRLFFEILQIFVRSVPYNYRIIIIIVVSSSSSNV